MIKKINTNDVNNILESLGVFLQILINTWAWKNLS